jgi:lysophospholipase L1-like esterase
VATRFQRYVAIGDSSTEGLHDPDGSGGFRGWADRLAEHVAARQGGLEYANLAIRGRTTRQIKADQLPVALALKPDLVTVVAGMNDLLNPQFNARAVAADVEAMFRAFADAGATVLSLTLPDLTPNLPFARIMGPRLVSFNEELRAAGDRVGAIMVDLGRFDDAANPRLWSDDRLHGNSVGHDVVARALAHGLSLPGFDESWRDPLPPPDRLARRAAVAAELRWLQVHALPWLWRYLTGRTAGDGLAPKRPQPLQLPATAFTADPFTADPFTADA